MFVLKYVCIKICLFLNKNKQKKPTDRPTDRPCGDRPEVGRSVGGGFFVVFFIKKQTYFNTNIFKNKHILENIHILLYKPT